MTEGLLHVGSLAFAKRNKRRYGAVLSVEDLDSRDVLRFHRDPRPQHLVLRFEDVDRPADGAATATSNDVETALAFARRHAALDLLVHCQAGVSRSTALALAILADRMGDERAAMTALLACRPEAVPNRLVVELADELLGRSGRLVAALESAERGNEAARLLRARRSALERQHPSLFAVA